MKSVKWLKVLLAVSSLLTIMTGVSRAEKIATVTYRYVEQADVQEYIKREKEFWKPIAEKAIEEGRMSNWSVWQKIGGVQLEEEPNILIYAEFDEVSDLESYGSSSLWKKVFPKKEFSDISVRSLYRTKAHLYQKPLINMVSSGDADMPKVIRINFAKANGTLADYLKMEQDVWAPFIAEQIKKGNTNITSWYLGEVLNPGGTDRPYDAVTVDGFGSLSAALSPVLDEGIAMPDLSEFGKVHKKVKRQLYRLETHAK